MLQTFAYTQRRRKAMARITNDTGATPAIQSQWTYRPKRGFIVALEMIDTTTIPTAHKSEDIQLRGILGTAFCLA